jgi:large repetitive protein
VKNWVRGLLVLLGIGSCWAAGPRASAEPILVVVPGTSDPWLAGEPVGTKASEDDFAPFQSPVPVGIPVHPDEILQFHAFGLVGHGPRWDEISPTPDGGTLFDTPGFHWTTHRTGAEHGIGNYDVPINALVGVFLSDARPDTTPAPTTLDFRGGGNVPGGINYRFLIPQLKQVFFIGDGLDGAALQQTVVVPTGATRLYLGTADGFEWANNQGAYAVTVTRAGHAPEPGSLTLLGLGAAGLAGSAWRRKRAS